MLTTATVVVPVICCAQCYGVNFQYWALLTNLSADHGSALAKCL